jgi:hypothetical protein
MTKNELTFALCILKRAAGLPPLVGILQNRQEKCERRPHCFLRKTVG